MPSLGSLFVQIGAKTDGLDKGGERATRTLKDLGASMRGVINTAGKLGVAAGAAGAALIAGLTRSGMQAIDANAKLARSLQASVDAIRGLQIAAEGAGLSDLEGSLNRLNRRLGAVEDRKSTRLNSSHVKISYAVF